MQQQHRNSDSQSPSSPVPVITGAPLDAPADCTLACDEGHLTAHKIMLCAHSKYLQDILAKFPNAEHPIIILTELNIADIKILVNYMYTGELVITNDGSPSSLLRAAQILKIDSLTDFDDDEQDHQQDSPQTTQQYHNNNNNNSNNNSNNNINNNANNNNSSSNNSNQLNNSNHSLHHFRQSPSPSMSPSPTPSPQPFHHHQHLNQSQMSPRSMQQSNTSVNSSNNATTTTRSRLSSNHHQRNQRLNNNNNNNHHHRHPYPIKNQPINKHHHHHNQKLKQRNILPSSITPPSQLNNTSQQSLPPQVQSPTIQQAVQQLALAKDSNNKIRCHLCNIGLSDVKCLYRHVLTRHLPEKWGYKCEFCDREFSRDDHLMRHYTTKHKNMDFNREKIRETRRLNREMAKNFHDQISKLGLDGFKDELGL